MEGTLKCFALFKCSLDLRCAAWQRQPEDPWAASAHKQQVCVSVCVPFKQSSHHRRDWQIRTCVALRTIQSPSARVVKGTRTSIQTKYKTIKNIFSQCLLSLYCLQHVARGQRKKSRESIGQHMLIIKKEKVHSLFSLAFWGTGSLTVTFLPLLCTAPLVHQSINFLINNFIDFLLISCIESIN